MIGAILKLREANRGPFSEEMQLVVDKLFIQLFRLHRQSSSHKGAVQFFHISKSGEHCDLAEWRSHAGVHKNLMGYSHFILEWSITDCKAIS